MKKEDIKKETDAIVKEVKKAATQVRDAVNVEEVKKAATTVKGAVKMEEVKKAASQVKDAVDVKEMKKAAGNVAEEVKKEAKKATTKASAKVNEVKKSATKKAESKLFIQFAGKSYCEADLVKMAKDVWKYDLKKKVGDFKTVDLYVKPEESMAYYVINDEYTGSFFI